MKKLLISIFIFYSLFLQAQKSVLTSSHFIIDSLLFILTENGEDTSKVNNLNLLSRAYFNAGIFEKALQHGSEALLLAEKISYLKGMANSSTSIGNINCEMGNYEVALECYIRSLKIKEKVCDKIGVASCLTNIGIIYFIQKKFENALNNYYKSLEIHKSLGNKAGMSILYNNIGLVYYNQGNYEKALESYFENLKIEKELGKKDMIGLTYNNIGNVYKDQKKYKEALDFQLKGLEISILIGDKQSVAFSYLNLGCIYTKLYKFKESNKYLGDALLIDKEIGNKYAVKEVYLSLSDLCEMQGDFKQAYEYHKLYSDLKDTLLNEESSKQITEMNAKYESEKKEREIELLTKDKALQGAEISKQKLIRNGTFGGLVIAMLFGFVLLNRFRVTNKQKKIIEHQNSQILESINYSKKIQDSLLPSVSQMQQALPSLFVFNSPKDIVSGDFYYFKEIEKHIVIACVDCTGHGVPGGFMSTLGSLLLDKIVDSGVLQPSEILLKLSDEIIRVLHQQNGGDIQDGMDLSVCLIDKENNTLEFSGARNGIVIVSNNEVKRYKANPLPVGGNYMKKGVAITRDFQTEKIQLQQSDWVYMYTDGFMEQSGGAGSVPMTSAEFENKLISLSQQATENKMQFLQKELDTWRGSNERADDVLIVGFQIS